MILGIAVFIAPRGRSFSSPPSRDISANETAAVLEAVSFWVSSSAEDASALESYRKLLSASTAMRERFIHSTDSFGRLLAGAPNRYTVVSQNWKRITRICKDVEEGQVCPFGENEFMDVPHAELASRLGIAIPSVEQPLVAAKEGFWSYWRGSKLRQGSTDWRDEARHRAGLPPVLTPVKTQLEGCQSCWAFAAVQQIESDYAIASGRLLELSPQQLLSTTYGWKDSPAYHAYSKAHRDGCESGWPPHAIVAAFAMGGVLNSSLLPYEGRASHQSAGAVRGKVERGMAALKLNPTEPAQFKVISSHIGADLKAAMIDMLHDGPLIAIMDGSRLDAIAHNYTIETHGPITRQQCGNNQLEERQLHAVQIVAYVEPGDYFIVRNSWGSGWADNGYFAVKADACSIVSKHAWQTHMPTHSLPPAPAVPKTCEHGCSWTSDHGGPWVCPGGELHPHSKGIAKDDGTPCFRECCAIPTLRNLLSDMAARTEPTSFIPSPVSSGHQRSPQELQRSALVKNFTDARTLGKLISGLEAYFSKIRPLKLSSSWPMHQQEEWLVNLMLMRKEETCTIKLLLAVRELIANGTEDKFFLFDGLRRRILTKLDALAAESDRHCADSEASECDEKCQWFPRWTDRDLNLRKSFCGRGLRGHLPSTCRNWICNWTLTWPCSTSEDAMRILIQAKPSKEIAGNDESDCNRYCCGEVTYSKHTARKLMRERNLDADSSFHSCS